MVRYFLALLPPEDIQEEVCCIQRKFVEQYQSCKALHSPPHITLQSPFDWSPTSITSDPTIPALIQRLTAWANSLQPLPIQLSEFGVFELHLCSRAVYPSSTGLTESATNLLCKSLGHQRYSIAISIMYSPYDSGLSRFNTGQFLCIITSCPRSLV